MFDVEHRIALRTMKGSLSSSLSEEEVSWFFTCCGGHLGYILELKLGLHFKIRVCLATSGLPSSCE